MASTLDSTMNWAIPALLIAIAIGFVYIKFLKPWLVPLLQDLIEWGKGKNAGGGEGGQLKIKEIIYE